MKNDLVSEMLLAGIALASFAASAHFYLHARVQKSKQRDANTTSSAAPPASDRTQTAKLPGLQQPVTIIRDTWGVPHIYARDEHDLFFAPGFATAQDRLFQMELWKRAGQGTLAEVLGPAFLQRDIGARQLKYRGDTPTKTSSRCDPRNSYNQAIVASLNKRCWLAKGHPRFT